MSIWRAIEKAKKARRGNFHIYIIRKSYVTNVSSKRTSESRALERSNQNLNRAATKEDTTPATKEDVTLAMHPSSNTPERRCDARNAPFLQHTTSCNAVGIGEDGHRFEKRLKIAPRSRGLGDGALPSGEPFPMMAVRNGHASFSFSVHSYVSLLAGVFGAVAKPSASSKCHDERKSTEVMEPINTRVIYFPSP